MRLINPYRHIEYFVFIGKFGVRDAKTDHVIKRFDNTLDAAMQARDNMEGRIAA